MSAAWIDVAIAPDPTAVELGSPSAYDRRPVNPYVTPPVPRFIPSEPSDPELSAESRQKSRGRQARAARDATFWEPAPEASAAPKRGRKKAPVLILPDEAGGRGSLAQPTVTRTCGNGVVQKIISQGRPMLSADALVGYEEEIIMLAHRGILDLWEPEKPLIEEAIGERPACVWVQPGRYWCLTPWAAQQLDLIVVDREVTTRATLPWLMGGWEHGDWEYRITRLAPWFGKMIQTEEGQTVTLAGLLYPDEFPLLSVALRRKVFRSL
jgi:hypothetical protein